MTAVLEHVTDHRDLTSEDVTDLLAASEPAERGRRSTAPARSGKETDLAARALLAAMADLPHGSTDRARIRERLIELYLPLA
jgi:hypothetical protein